MLTRFLSAALPAVFGAACVAAIATAPLAQQPDADELPDATALLDKMDKSVRAGMTIEAIRSVSLAGTCELHIAQQDQPSTGRFEEYYAGGKSYLKSSFGDFHVEQGCNGEVAWEIDPMAGAMILEGDAAAAERRLVGLTLGDPWRKHFDLAKCIGIRTLGGEKCWVVQMKPKQGRNEIWYVTQDQERLAGVDMWKYSPGGESDIEVRFAGWKPVDGIPYPITMTAHVENADVVFRYETITHNAEIPAARFALPAAIAEAAAAAQKTGAPNAGPQKTEAPKPDPSELVVKIIELSEQPVASIRIKTDAEKIGSTLAVAIPEVAKYLAEAKVQMIGYPFTRYHAFGDGGKEMDVEVGFPVGRPIVGKERVQPSVLPAGKVAEVWHVGHYQDLGKTWQRLEKWLAENGHQPGDARWELYHTDPRSEPDASKWRTQIRWAIQ